MPYGFAYGGAGQMKTLAGRATTAGGTVGGLTLLTGAIREGSITSDVIVDTAINTLVASGLQLV